MLTNQSDTSLTQLVKEHQEFQSIIQNLYDDHKQATSMLIHELRNPLSLLKGTIQFIEAKHPEVNDFKYWDQLEDLVNDMEQMMVDASLLNAYHSLQLETISFPAFMQGIIDSFMPRAISSHIDISLSMQSCDEDILNHIPCDSSKLKHVFTNLIKNAFEATSEGNYIKVNLSCYTENSDSKLSIEVSNNGLPIPEDEITKIFIPFVTYKKGGTGVGLAIVKRIIDLHYGTIDATSDDDSTSFTITLPIDLLAALNSHTSL